MTLGKLHTKACRQIEELRITNKAGADKVDRLMAKALTQFYQNQMPEQGLRAILSGIVAGDLTPLINHFDVPVQTLPSSINQ